MAVNFLARDTVLQISRTAAVNSSLTVGAINRAPTATGIFNFVNTSPLIPTVQLANSVYATNQIFVGGPAGVMNQGLYVQTGTYTDFAYRDPSGFVRPVAYGIDPNSTFTDGTTPIAPEV